MRLAGSDLEAAYYCVARELRRCDRGNLPVPPSVRRLFDRLDLEFRVSQSRQENDCAGEQSESEKLITAKEAATLMDCSKRTVLRLKADIDGRMIGGRLLFDRAVVAEYATERKACA